MLILTDLIISGYTQYIIHNLINGYEKKEARTEGGRKQERKATWWKKKKKRKEKKGKWREKIFGDFPKLADRYGIGCHAMAEKFGKMPIWRLDKSTAVILQSMGVNDLSVFLAGQFPLPCLRGSLLWWTFHLRRNDNAPLPSLSVFLLISPFQIYSRLINFSLSLSLSLTWFLCFLSFHCFISRSFSCSFFFSANCL